MEGLVVVYRAAGITQAELIRGYLESEGIPTDLDYESAGPVLGLTMDGLGEVRICVPEGYEEEARAALAQRLSESSSHLHLVDFEAGDPGITESDADESYLAGSPPPDSEASDGDAAK